MLYLALFFSLFLISNWIQIPNFNFFDFPKRTIGVATLDNIDVKARISYIYKMFYTVTAFFICFTLLLRILQEKLSIEKKALQLMNYAALAGVLLLFCGLMNNPVDRSLDLIMLFIATVFSGFLIRKYSGLKTEGISYFYLWTSLLGFAIYFIPYHYELLLSKYYFHFHFGQAHFIITILLQSLSCFIEKRRKISLEIQMNHSRFLFLSPLFFVAATELYMILNQRNVAVKSSFLVESIFLIVAFGLAFWYYHKKERQSGEKILSTLLLPATIFSLCCFAYYQTTMVASTELFEQGNPANGLMRTMKYGEIPILEYMTSHLFDELLLPFIYSLLNGYSENTAYLLYNFLKPAIGCVIIYYFLLKSFNKAAFAFISVLFFPFFTAFYSLYYVMCFLAIFVLNNWLNKGEQKNYYALFGIFAFLIVWRLDIGFANMFAMWGTVLVFCLAKHTRFDWKKAFKALWYVIGIPALLAIVISLIKGIDLWEHFRLAMHYFGDSQNHGYSILSYDYGDMFRIHFIIFPLLALALLIYLLSHLKKFTVDKQERFLVLALVYLILFYFANFQRGIERHGFVENTDGFLSSYSFLIFSLGTYFILKRYSINTRLIVFSVMSLLLIKTYKLRGISEQKNQIELLSEQIKYKHHPDQLTSPIERSALPEGFYEEHIKDIKSFLDTNFEKDATFIDFSNTPMLYFYTGRNVPSYFCQSLQNSHNDFLQQGHIQKVEEMDVPVVIFSNAPTGFWDALDEVPNTVRHFRLAEYIYRHYQPYGVINKHDIWIRKDVNIDKQSYVNAPSQAGKLENYQLRYLPFLWGNYDSMEGETKVLYEAKGNETNLFEIPKIDTSKGNYIEIIVEGTSDTDSEIVLEYGRQGKVYGSYRFYILSGSIAGPYKIRVSSQYNWYAKDINFVAVKGLPENASISSLQISTAD